MRVVAFLFVLAYALAAQTVADSTVTVAVLGFWGEGESEGLKHAAEVADLFRTELAGIAGISVVPASDVDAALQALGVPGGCPDRPCAGKAGQAVGASRVVWGTVLGEKRKLAVGAEVVEASTGNAKVSHQEKAKDARGLKGAVAKIVANLARSLLQRGDSDTACDLSGRNLEGRDFSGGNFDGCDLTGANFRNANLVNCSFVKARLTGATLVHADLGGAKLDSADFTGANLADADLSGAILKGTNFGTANLTGATIDHTWLKDLLRQGLTDTSVVEWE